MNLNSTKISDKPGVYLLIGNDKKILYVGKASNLKLRLKSYKRNSSNPRINRLISKINTVNTFEVGSPVEALILEANLIKQYKPEFNVLLKDDKDYIYIKITKDIFPRVLSARKKSLTNAQYYFGPYPSSESVRRTLKIIRKIFPYSNCKPGSKRACLHFHLGLCPGVCVGKISQKNYLKNIRRIKLFLEGKKDSILRDLEKERRYLSAKLNYEGAAETHEKILALEYVSKPRNDVTRYMEDKDFLLTYRLSELKELKKVLGLRKIPKRIEGYDISNIQGEYATGSMVVILNGEAKKSEYRKFRIKKVVGISDTAMMEEIIRRRFKNNWDHPDLIMVDGGKGQRSACLKVLKQFNLKITCIGLAKKQEQIYTPNSNYPIRLPRNSKALHVVQRLRDEAHRFAIRYHRHLIGKDLLTVQMSSVSLKK